MNHTDFKSYIEEGQKNIDHTQKDISIIGQKLGFQFKDNNNNSKEFHNFIYEGIDRLLGGNDFDRSQFNKIRSRIAIELFVDDNDDNKKSFQYIEIINDAFRKTNNFSNDPKKWIQAMEFISAHLVVGRFDPLTLVELGYKKEKALAKSFKYLTHKGYCIEIIEDSLRCNMEEHRKICSVIDSNLKLLGEMGICEIVIKIKNLYDKEIERYIFPRVSEIPLIPWGFLFKLAIKNFGQTKNLQNPSEVWKEAIELSANYATMLGIQEYFAWEMIFIEPRNLLETLERLVLNDQVYSINQVRSSHILELIEKIFLNEPFNSFLLPWCISDYKLVVKAIINLAKTKTPYKFTAKKIYDNIGCELQLEKIVHILDSLSHGEGVLNKEFLMPFDSLENNINLKPLIKTGKLEYMILDLPLFCYGFYEVLYQACLSFGLKEIEMGELLERFVCNKLTEGNIKFMHGEKYKLDSSMRNLLGTKREDGECDFIIETNDTIIFIELKKKMLTREAQGGNVESISSDLIKSFLAAQIQCNWHEIILKKNGKIQFISNKVLKWEKRKIEKISLSMFDYMSLHDGMVVSKIMKGLLNSKLLSINNDKEVDKKLEPLNKLLVELNSQYLTEELKEYLVSNHSFISSRFLSIFHLIEMLKDVNSAEEFKDELQKNKHIFTGEKDWYFENKTFRRRKSR